MKLIATILLLTIALSAMPAQGSALQSAGETCSNYGIRIIVSTGDTCRYGTCKNEGVEVVVTTGGFCGYDLVGACVDDICLPGCRPWSGCGTTQLRTPHQDGAGVDYQPCPNGSEADSQRGGHEVPLRVNCQDQLALRSIPVADCDVEPSTSQTLMCGEEGETCGVLDAVICWSGRLVCSFISGPVHAVHELIRRHSEVCRGQPGCCPATVETRRE